MLFRIETQITDDPNIGIEVAYLEMDEERSEAGIQRFLRLFRQTAFLYVSGEGLQLSDLQHAAIEEFVRLKIIKAKTTGQDSLEQVPDAPGQVTVRRGEVIEKYGSGLKDAQLSYPSDGLWEPYSAYPDAIAVMSHRVLNKTDDFFPSFQTPPVLIQV